MLLESQAMGGRHAWNIVSFNGKEYYPIDLTWENAKFRGRSIKDT